MILNGINNKIYNMKLEELKAQIDEQEAQIQLLKEQFRIEYQKVADICKLKIQSVQLKLDSFTENELIFSAFSRCECGAGLAYPKDIGPHGSWYCSDILLGRALSENQPGSKTHSFPLSFMFYEVKSENQPSANGATTRPAIKRGKYEKIRTKEEYELLLKSGMFWEFHPELTGNWEEDYTTIINEN
jgi:hypothetical protein